MKQIIVKECSECPKLEIRGCGYECYFCNYKPFHLKQLDRYKVDTYKEYIADWCPLDDVEG